ncbi:MAG: multicopper oxidase domain-containing protein [Microlunatus sp.]
MNTAATTAVTRCRKVVAMSLPIVYDNDGDCDRDGLIFAIEPHQPLLRWLRDRLTEGDSRLLRLHLQRQHAQVAVDGLAKLEEMIARLTGGTDEERAILRRLWHDESDGVSLDARNIPRRHGESDHAHAVRTNLTTTLVEVRTALTELTKPVHGAGAEDEFDGAAPAEVDPEAGPALLTLTPAERTDLANHWDAQLRLLTIAVDQQLATITLDVPALAAASGMPQHRVRQLMLNDWSTSTGRAEGLPYDRANPLRPMPVVQPLVLRTRLGEPLRIRVENQIRGRRVGFHVQGEPLGRADGQLSGDGVRFGDGSHTGANPDSTIPPPDGDDPHHLTYTYGARHEGVWLVHDAADVDGSERGTNIHGLFGAIIVEPPGVRWRDPQIDWTAPDVDPWLDDKPWDSQLHVDVVDPAERPGTPEHLDYVDLHSDDVPRSFREFTVFMHDEPELHSGVHAGGMHSWMPLSYRAEPMVNRLPHRMRRMVEKTPELGADQHGIDRNAFGWRLGRELEDEFWTARTPDGRWLEQISGEEQHHSSWLFGEPATPVLRAYAGDPCRLRLVHAGIKETHIFHLHVHQWRAVAADTAPPGNWAVGEDGRPVPHGSQLLDSITISPQAAMTIDPLYGSGSRQHAFGDIIWHCHLYPHFHHGMWGLWRSLDRLVDGTRPYPDGTPCPPLTPLPGRTPPAPEVEHPGFPWFIDAAFPTKSPPPPAPVPEHVVGRRRLLGLPAHSAKELAAMPPAVRDGHSPGAVFVDLDGLAETWNARAGLPAPRIVAYDIESRIDRIDYNLDGWHDPRGCRYRLRRAEIREQDENGQWHVTASESFEFDRDQNPVPAFPRANHGDIVELRMFNSLRSLSADAEDLGVHPVECGLHVHLVKFDVTASDGSATGWNYLSGASCREAIGTDLPGELPRIVSLHRWVVDEEFGPCFFHDHLLANYRQKHGLWSALIAEPFGSQWQLASDQSRTAWSHPDAVIVPEEDTGLPPFREACLSVQDFVPLQDRHGRALNPPSVLSGVDDPGVMAVSYRSAPMHFRGRDPSLWFSTTASSRQSMHGTPGDPDTAIIETYPGERLRIRLVQGSHEEGHNFQAHGLRWRRDWGNPRSPLVNQQTIGISEAFTLDIDPAAGSAYGVGDHLWHLGGLDDLWLGCWGYVRALPPTPANHTRLAPLPQTSRTPAASPAVAIDPAAATAPVRTFVVVAQRTEHRFRGAELTDPWGLIYRVAEYDCPEDLETELQRARETGCWRPGKIRPDDRPLVLRARRGERIRVFLVNLVLDEVADLPPFSVEVAPPRLFVEHLDEQDRPDRRAVSPQVSLRPSLLQFDVRGSDGSFVGRNPDQTVAPAKVRERHGEQAEGAGPVVHRRHSRHEVNWREYQWYADEELAPASSADGPGRVCVLKDMGDVRNHRHHGLIGALVVEPGDVTPWQPGSYRSGSAPAEANGWSGVEAELRTAAGELVAREGAVFFQDGLRQFIGGQPTMPVSDVPLEDENELDSGLKAISYRTALIHRGRPPVGADAEPPLLTVDEGDTVWLRVVGAGDKLRQHAFTVHGVAWQAAPWVPGSAWTSLASGVVGGWSDDVVVIPREPGDHAVRTGCYRFGTEMGVWSTVRVRGLS